MYFHNYVYTSDIENIEKSLARHYRHIDKLWKRGDNLTMKKTLTIGFDWHDTKIILFHILVAAAQSALVAAGKENYGTWTPTAVLIIQIISEVVRRILV